MQVRRELVVFQHSFQNWNFRGGFGCGDEFSGVWMLATEVHLLPPWCARVLFPLPQPGVCSRHDGHWETVTLCPQKKKKRLVSAFALQRPSRLHSLQLDKWPQQA